MSHLGEGAQLELGARLAMRHGARARADVELHHLRGLERARVGEGEAELEGLGGADGGGGEAQVAVLEGGVAQAVAEGEGHGAAGEVSVAHAQALAVHHLLGVRVRVGVTGSWCAG